MIKCSGFSRCLETQYDRASIINAWTDSFVGHWGPQWVAGKNCHRLVSPDNLAGSSNACSWDWWYFMCDSWPSDVQWLNSECPAWPSLDEEHSATQQNSWIQNATVTESFLESLWTDLIILLLWNSNSITKALCWNQPISYYFHQSAELSNFCDLIESENEPLKGVRVRMSEFARPSK